jgi:tRNA(Ile2)-agmatinylcytidine synthase
MRFLLGVDDTDSLFGHCTTHLGYLIVSELARAGFIIPTYPRLVRLNPNIPFKTRGNAAVCVEFEADLSKGETAFEVAARLLEEQADVSNGANSALIVVPKSQESSFFRELYERAVCGVVNYRGVELAVARMGALHRLLGNGMGIVGAAASLGFSCELDDHTYELIAYRMPENCGRPRTIGPASVEKMELQTFPHTFNSYDHESGRVLVAPTGPDPVLAGVRGDSPRAVLDAFRRIELGETPLGHVIYGTNQCTGAHVRNPFAVPLKAYSAGWLEGVVTSTVTSSGSHLSVGVRTGDGSTLTCMVYEPSGDLRRIARLLLPGDAVRVSGGVRRASSKNPEAINVEKLEVLKLALPRASRLRPGTYLPSPRAQRHLTKQLTRYGREQVGPRPLVKGWIEAPRRLEKLKIESANRRSRR